MSLKRNNFLDDNIEEIPFHLPFALPIVQGKKMKKKCCKKFKKGKRCKKCPANFKLK